MVQRYEGQHAWVLCIPEPLTLSWSHREGWLWLQLVHLQNIIYYSRVRFKKLNREHSKEAEEGMESEVCMKWDSYWQTVHETVNKYIYPISTVHKEKPWTDTFIPSQLFTRSFPLQLMPVRSYRTLYSYNVTHVKLVHSLPLLLLKLSYF